MAGVILTEDGKEVIRNMSDWIAGNDHKLLDKIVAKSKLEAEAVDSVYGGVVAFAVSPIYGVVVNELHDPESTVIYCCLRSYCILASSFFLLLSKQL